MAEADLTPPPPPNIRSASSGDEDWKCGDCSNVNFSWRNNCNRCAKSRPSNNRSSASKKRKLGTEIGKAAAEKSRGLFSADDWQCNKCLNVNWARRQSCNVCNAPKFGEVEERTGFGGGYNDRGVVEYKERNDSDDEYDEFGRRKKKRRSSNNKENSRGEKDKKGRSDEEDGDEEQRKVKEEEEETERRRRDDENKGSKIEEREEDEEEEEEDEEDDDDGDLSKYDLSDWGDSSDNKK